MLLVGKQAVHLMFSKVRQYGFQQRCRSVVAERDRTEWKERERKREKDYLNMSEETGDDEWIDGRWTSDSLHIGGRLLPPQKERYKEKIKESESESEPN